MTKIAKAAPKARRVPAGKASSPTAVQFRAAEPPPGVEPPRRPTRARLQAFFLGQFARSGSLADAAARTGIAARTVQRWRLVNPAFARRYASVLESRVEILEDLAMRRALGADRRPVFHQGKQVATVERHNDVMLMRVLARFDRLREQAARALVDSDGYDDIRLLDEAGRQAALALRAHESSGENVVVQATRQADADRR